MNTWVPEYLTNWLLEYLNTFVFCYLHVGYSILLEFLLEVVWNPQDLLLMMGTEILKIHKIIDPVKTKNSHSYTLRINLCPYASKYWRFKSFILHFISPFTITHLFKWLRTSFFSLLISILSSFCWNAEVLICKAFSDWSKFCLLLSFCYLKL